MADFLRAPDLTVEKGIDFSVPSVYLGKGQNYPQNFQLYRGEMKKRDGRSVLGTISVGAHKVLHLGIFELTTGTQRLIRHTKQNVHRFNAANGLWEDITGTDLTGTETSFFSHAVVTEDDLYCFTNQGVDNIRKYTDSGNTANLGGSPPKCKSMEYLSPYLLIGNIIDGGTALPQKVQWCDTGNAEVWTGGNSGSIFLADEPSFIKTIKKLLDYGFVYKEKSVYRARKVTSSSIFDFGGPFVIGKGLGAPRAIADDGLNHYYMGLFDFHQNNSVRVGDIGGPVREYIFNRLNRARIDTCFAIHVEIYKEIWFFVTISGFDWPTEVWKYNYERGFWYFDTVKNCITGINYKQTVDLTWDTDTVPPTWDEEITFWDDQQGLTDAPFQVFGYDDGFVDRINSNVVDDRGVAVDSKIDSKDYTGLAHKGVEYETRWMQFDVWARGFGNIKVSYSTDYGGTWTFIDSQELTPFTEKLTFWFDIFAAHIRFRMQIDDKGSSGTIRAFTPYFKDYPEMTRRNP